MNAFHWFKFRHVCYIYVTMVGDTLILKTTGKENIFPQLDQTLFGLPSFFHKKKLYKPISQHEILPKWWIKRRKIAFANDSLCYCSTIILVHGIDGLKLTRYDTEGNTTLMHWGTVMNKKVKSFEKKNFRGNWNRRSKLNLLMPKESTERSCFFTPNKYCQAPPKEVTQKL